VRAVLAMLISIAVGVVVIALVNLFRQIGDLVLVLPAILVSSVVSAFVGNLLGARKGKRAVKEPEKKEKG